MSISIAILSVLLALGIGGVQPADVVSGGPTGKAPAAAPTPPPATPADVVSGGPTG